MAGEIGKINISESTMNEVKDTYNIIPRGKIKIKNNEEIPMYFVLEKKAINE